jgi:hypothetical protein
MFSEIAAHIPGEKHKATGAVMKLWEKGYELNKKVEDFTVGNDYILDNKLVEPDCVASKAHARMLGNIGILTQEEVKMPLPVNLIILSNFTG